MQIRKCGCKRSTCICGCVTAGTGRLDNYGFWEHPCKHGNEFMPVQNCGYHGEVTENLLAIEFQFECYDVLFGLS